MNNLRLLTRLFVAAFVSGGVSAYAEPSVVTLEEIFEAAEANSVQLRPFVTAQNEAAQEISVARSARLPEIDATLSYTVILVPCDGYTSRKEIQVGQLVQPGQTLLDSGTDH